MLKTSFVLLFLTCGVTIAFAQDCPTSDDLETGIRLTRHDPSFVSVFRRDAGDLSERRESRGRVIHTRETHALMTVERWEEGQNNHMRLSYDANPAELDNLRPGRSLKRDLRLRFADGREVPGDVTWKVIRNTTVHIGPCSYPAQQVHERTDFEGVDPMFMVRFYARDPGLVLRSIVTDGNWQAVREVRFDQIERVMP